MFGRATQAEIYPDKLCKVILKGLVEQMKADGRIEAGSIGSVAPTDEARQNWEEYYDDLSGERLNSDMVRQAREERMCGGKGDVGKGCERERYIERDI